MRHGVLTRPLVRNSRCRGTGAVVAPTTRPGVEPLSGKGDSAESS